MSQHHLQEVLRHICNCDVSQRCRRIAEGEVAPGSHRWRTATPLHTLASHTSEWVLVRV